MWHLQAEGGEAHDRLRKGKKRTAGQRERGCGVIAVRMCGEAAWSGAKEDARMTHARSGAFGARATSRPARTVGVHNVSKAKRALRASNNHPRIRQGSVSLSPSSVVSPGTASAS